MREELSIYYGFEVNSKQWVLSGYHEVKINIIETTITYCLS